MTRPNAPLPEQIHVRAIGIKIEALTANVIQTAGLKAHRKSYGSLWTKHIGFIHQSMLGVEIAPRRQAKVFLRIIHWGLSLADSSQNTHDSEYT